MNHRRLRYLQEMGIHVWVPRVPLTNTECHKTSVEGEDMDRVDTNSHGVPQQEIVSETLPLATQCHNHPVSSSSQLLSWDHIEARVKTCVACPLYVTRTQTVFGAGHPAADWMFIGEAPGEQEDLRGEPFVGPAGQLLTQMIRAIGLQRETVYIANILKCRPPKNRDPTSEEVSACEGYLKSQIALVRPKIIVALGRVAAQSLLKTTTPIGKLRGHVHHYEGVPLIVTYHPAYLLRSPMEKRQSWKDLKSALVTFYS